MGKTKKYTFVKRNCLQSQRSLIKIKRTLIKKIDLKLMHTFTTRE